MDINTGQILANRAFLSPHMEACLGADYRFTFKEANARANRFAGYLAAQGIRRGDRIAVLAKNNEHAVSALYGAAKIGGDHGPAQLALERAGADLHPQRLRG